MTRSRPCSRLRRRALDRSSGTVMLAVSSMKILVSERFAGSAAQTVPVFLVQVSGIDPVGIDPGFAAQQAFHELFLAHFEAEDADGLVLPDRDMLGNVEAEAGFAQSGPGGNDDEVRRMQAGRHLVEIDESRFPAR